jgi:L-ascorbate metabolism protein UlaG (beta-lactamase superfamily)
MPTVAKGAAVHRVTWLGHSTVVIEVDGARLVTDPVLRRRIWHLRRSDAVTTAAVGDVDGVLISHAHFDHLDLRSLEKFDRSIAVVVPDGAGRLVRRRGFAHVLEVAAGDELEIGGVRVRATNAEHAPGRGPFSPRSAALGYVVDGSVAVYFAGDTDLFDGMAELGALDLACLPVWGWGARLPAGHLDPLRAAEALRLLRPQAAVPIHWGTFKAPFAPRSGSTPAREFARAAARLAPEVEIHTLQIGDSLALAHASSVDSSRQGDVRSRRGEETG